MAQPSLQDVKKPFDPTSYVTITGAALAQYADGIAPYADKGLIVVTTDVASVAQVPDANTNTKWQNYLWVRRLATSVVAYVWNPTATSDPVYLQWINISLASLADGSVTNSKIAPGAVTNDKIFSVDWSKITSVPSTIMLQGSAAGGDLTGTYPNPTIAANAVNSSKLASDAAADINRAVTSNHIQSGAVTISKLDPNLLTGFAPVGSVTMFGGSAAPVGWFECNGAAVSRGTYASLFAAIGTSYGNGDGVTTFNLPDMRGYFPRGWDHGAGVDAARALGSTQQDKLLDHTHDSPANSSFRLAVAAAGTEAGGGAGTVVSLQTQTNTIHGATGGGTETRPKNVSFMFIIKHD